MVTAAGGRVIPSVDLAVNQLRDFKFCQFVRHTGRVSFSRINNPVSSTSDGKPAPPDPFAVNHDNRPRQLCVNNRHQDALHTILALGFTVVPAAQEDQARRSRAQRCEKPWEVQVRRDDYATTARCGLKNLGVRTPVHREFVCMDGVMAFSAQPLRQIRRQRHRPGTSTAQLNGLVFRKACGIV